jgi:hypothetical protein
MRRLLALILGCLGCLLLNGCAALAPFSSLVSLPSSPPAPQVFEETRVDLGRDNFVLVKANVRGESKGFSLLGVITMSPATVTKAMNRMYASAQLRVGEPQTLANLVVNQSSSYWILFGIPKVEVRADVVEFNPLVRANRDGKSKPAPAKPPDDTGGR